MEIKNSPLLARDSGACVPSSLRQHKKRCAREGMGTRHAHVHISTHTNHTHTYNTQTCMHMHTYTQSTLSELPAPTPQGPPDTSLQTPQQGREGPWLDHLHPAALQSILLWDQPHCFYFWDGLASLPLPEVHSRSEAAGMQNWTSPPHSLTFMGSLLPD